jgi:hypothetical protein
VRTQNRANLIHENLLEIVMLGLIARWGHNVLLATLGVLTVAIVISVG